MAGCDADQMPEAPRKMALVKKAYFKRNCSRNRQKPNAVIAIATVCGRFYSHTET
jgi:hypothetical protein